MPDFSLDTVASGSNEKVWSAAFTADGAASVPEVGREWRQVSVRRRKAVVDAEADLGSGALKLQTASVAIPTLDQDNHWNDTDDTTLSALEIGKSYKVELSGPLRIVLTGSTSPDVVVEVR